MSEDDAVSEALDRCALLSAAAVGTLFARYGHPLESDDVTLDPTIRIDELEVGRLRYRSPVDVIDNDYFVLRRDGETLAMPGPLFAAAVAALTRTSTDPRT